VLVSIDKRAPGKLCDAVMNIAGKEARKHRPPSIHVPT
jgi:hypothetical protein